MENASRSSVAAAVAYAKSGAAAFARLCLGFLGGWWLLQFVLLGTGMIAIDRVQSQFADEHVADLGAILQLAMGQSTEKWSIAPFDAQANAILQSDPNLAAIMLVDRNGAVLRGGGRTTGTIAPDALRLPVRDGTIVLSIDHRAAKDAAWRRRLTFILAALVVPLLHLPLSSWLRRRLGYDRKLSWILINGLTGMVTSLLLVGCLMTEAHTNARIKTEAMDRSLTIAMKESLAPATTDLRRLDRLLAAYQELDPRIVRVVLSFALGGQSRAATQSWEQAQEMPLDEGRSVAILRRWRIIDVTPAVQRGLKNISVLIVAIAVLCTVLAGTRPGFKFPLGALRRTGRPSRTRDGAREVVLATVRPIYFMAVLAENLCAPFLPRVLHDSVAQAHLPPEVASALFMAYFFAFTAVLLPASRLTARFGEAGLIRGGAALLALGLTLPALSLDAFSLMMARLLMGAGQGVLLIGVQSLILATTSAKQRTIGTAIIVFGFNGGMVGGNAFGSLLVERFGPQMVFGVAAAAAAVVAVVALATLAQGAGAPQLDQLREATPADAPSGDAASGEAAGLRCLADRAFLTTTLCIGIPAKAVLTGVVLFALPLILSRRGFNLEEVGQIVMFYAAGVLAATSLISRRSNRHGHTGALLTAGAMLSAAAMAAVLMVDSAFVAQGQAQTAVIVGCIFVLGMAHGGINAPVVTHIAGLPVAQRLGPVGVAASYRLVERAGHIGGPLIVERILSACASETQALAWIGGGVAAGALVFAFRTARNEPAPSPLHAA